MIESMFPVIENTVGQRFFTPSIKRLEEILHNVFLQNIFNKLMAAQNHNNNNNKKLEFYKLYNYLTPPVAYTSFT